MGTEAGLLVSPVGIEPTTNWLKASCSTTELRAREPTPYGAVFTLSTGVANGRGAAEIAGRSPSHVENPPRRLRHRILAETSPSWKRQPIGLAHHCGASAVRSVGSSSPEAPNRRRRLSRRPSS